MNMVSTKFLTAKLLVLATLLIGLMGCSKHKDDSAPEGVVALNQSDVLVMPMASGAATSVSTKLAVETVAEGRYSLSEVKTYSENSDGTVAAFTHTIGTPGNFAKPDHLRKAAKWGPVESENTLQVTVEMNVPEEIVKRNGQSPEHNRIQYYWHYSRSNGEWGWLATDEQNYRSSGTDVVGLMDRAPQDTFGYKTLFVQDGSKLYFWYSRSRGLEKITVRLTYIAGGSVAESKPAGGDIDEGAFHTRALLGELDGLSLKLKIRSDLNLFFDSMSMAKVAAFRAGKMIGSKDVEENKESFCEVTSAFMGPDNMGTMTQILPELKVQEYGASVNGKKVMNFPEVLIYTANPTVTGQVGLRCTLHREELPLSLESLNAIFDKSIEICAVGEPGC